MAKPTSQERRKLRVTAESFVQFARLKAAPEKPAPPPAKSATPAPRPPAAVTAAAREKPPEPLRAAVQFFPTRPPAFAHEGTVADYFLRRQWTELQMAQNFEDLLCLPSLHGVDAYIYQQETVRNVLRHFKSRALLADEVGLGKRQGGGCECPLLRPQTNSRTVPTFGWPTGIRTLLAKPVRRLGWWQSTQRRLAACRDSVGREHRTGRSCQPRSCISSLPNRLAFVGRGFRCMRSTTPRRILARSSGALTSGGETAVLE
jgi:hypothetical protein